MLPKEFESQDT